jgi:hypothetical protein
VPVYIILSSFESHPALLVNLPCLNNREIQHDVPFIIFRAVFFHNIKYGSSLDFEQFPPDIPLKEVEMPINLRLGSLNSFLFGF